MDIYYNLVEKKFAYEGKLRTRGYGRDYGGSESLAVIPVVIFYLACQKHIIKGVAAGAVKG